MDTLITYGIGGIICFFFLMIYLRSLKKREARAREAAEKGKLFSEGPKAQHPHIDNNYCIGCATCTSVCPEGDVLAMIGGKAVIVNGHKCIGHGLCADACPVGAITMVMASPSMAADMPTLNARVRNHGPESVYRGRARRLGPDQERRQSGTRLRRHDCCPPEDSRLSRSPPGRARPASSSAPDRRESAHPCAPSSTS